MEGVDSPVSGRLHLQVRALKISPSELLSILVYPFTMAWAAAAGLMAANSCSCLSEVIPWSLTLVFSSYSSTADFLSQIPTEDSISMAGSYPTGSRLYSDLATLRSAVSSPAILYPMALMPSAGSSWVVLSTLVLSVLVEFLSTLVSLVNYLQMAKISMMEWTVLRI